MFQVLRHFFSKNKIPPVQLEVSNEPEAIINEDYDLIKESPLFDPVFYRNQLGEEGQTLEDPVEHFLSQGSKAANPSPQFDCYYYLSQYHDVLISRMNPLVHYLKYGQNEKRSTLPPPLSSEPVLNSSYRDLVIEVPFNFEHTDFEPEGRIAVICHFFYLDLMEEIWNYLGHIPYPFDLFITTNTPEKAARLNTFFSARIQGRLEIKLFPNKGRDIAPKLLAWKEVYQKYPYFLHLHSKKSKHTASYSTWRNDIFNKILGSPEVVRSIFMAFAQDPNLGMIGPQCFEPIRTFIGWGCNFPIIEPLCRKMGIPITIDHHIDFPPGSMFWCKRGVLDPLLYLNLSVSDFPDESGQLDKTLAHAIERLYYLSCEKAGYKWLKVGRASSLFSLALEVTSTEELSEAMNHVYSPLTVERKLQLQQLEPESFALKHQVKEGHITGIFLERSHESLTSMFGKSYMKMIHRNSPLNDLSFEVFQEEYQKFKFSEDSKIDFDESFYCTINPDVGAAVQTGEIDSGYAHYCIVGRFENRIWSNLALNRKFSLSNNLASGIFWPKYLGNRLPVQVTPLQLKRPQKIMSLVILVSYLEKSIFFAGMHSFFKDLQSIFALYDEVLVFVEQEKYEPQLAEKYHPGIQVKPLHELQRLKFFPELIVTYNSSLYELALKLFKKSEKILYYCQDFEGGFFPYGSQYITGERAVITSKNLIISTDLLHRFFIEQQLLSPGTRVYITSPEIKPIPVHQEAKDRLFFYYRPEIFQSRNLADSIMDAVLEFCTHYEGYELYLVGSVDTRFSFTSGNNEIFVINKLPYPEYQELLSSCKVVVSLIYSAHPGVVAFQAAASGIPTVTNTFQNRDATLLQALSSNIVPYDPIRDSLYEKVVEAMDKPRGNPSFAKDLYSREPETTFTDFIQSIQKSSI